MYISSITVI